MTNRSMTRSKTFALIVAVVALLSAITIGVLVAVGDASAPMKVADCMIAILILTLATPLARYALADSSTGS
jgi:ABC-type transport system involved in cytochrome bd biosynthesis fused ATPase/permease subunit